MLDESALRYIGQIAIGDYNGKQERLAGTGTIALPENINIHDLEKYQPGRKRFRGALCTSDLADFVAYVKRQAKSECFIDADKLTACALFNLGSTEEPGHADWTATLSLRATAAYKALTGINGQRMDQRGIIDWIEDWKQAGGLQPVNEGGDQFYGALSKAVAAIRQVKIKATNETTTTQENFAASQSTFDKVEASSVLELPDGFTFTCVPYIGLPARTFFLRLAVLTGGKDPVLVLRVVQLEAAQEEFAREFKQVLQMELSGAAQLTIGTFKA